MQLVNLWMISVIVKIRFNMFIWFLNFLMIMSMSIKRVRFISLAICIRLFIILYYFMYLVFSHIEWWMLKFFTNKYLSDLLSNYCKLYMREFLLMFCRNFRNDEYTLWMCSIMSFSLKISDEKSDFKCFII